MSFDPYMTAAEAITWIATRDEAFAAKNADASPTAIIIEIVLWRRNGSAPRFDLGAAERELIAACRGDRVAVYGRVGNSDQPTAARIDRIAPYEWTELSLDHDGDQMLASPDLMRVPIGGGSTYWRGLQFSRADMVAAFPRIADPTFSVELTDERHGIVDRPATQICDIETDARGSPGRPSYFEEDCKAHMRMAELRRTGQARSVREAAAIAYNEGLGGRGASRAADVDRIRKGFASAEARPRSGL